MARDNAISRRTAMKLTGAAAATALVAGCGGDDDEGNGGNGNGNGNGDGDTFNIEAGERIVLFAETSGWEGVEPSDIDGVQNPTLVLEEGEDYEIGWEEGNGQEHNIELRDDSGEVVDDYETERVAEEEPDDQFIEFEATDEIAIYRCEPHAQMEGEIQVEGGNGDENGEENGDENGEENSSE